MRVCTFVCVCVCVYVCVCACVSARARVCECLRAFAFKKRYTPTEQLACLIQSTVWQSAGDALWKGEGSEDTNRDV